jgi:MSHA biogenesis protein MshE
MISQREVGRDVKSFHEGLKEMMREDPDVIFVGEMRDAETIAMTLMAAETGHLVFSTLHTRDAAGTLFRLVDMGVPKYMVVSTVQLVLAQRLLRRVCESCSEPYAPTPQELEWLTFEGVPPERWARLLHGRGCSRCNGTGYNGRLAVYEMLEMDRTLAEAAAHTDALHFTQTAQAHMKGRTMLDHALLQLEQGRTTISEVMQLSQRVED